MSVRVIRSDIGRPTIWGTVIAGSFALAFFGTGTLFPSTYDTDFNLSTAGAVESSTVHMQTPNAVKAIYMTQCVVGTPHFRNKLVNLIEETELNSVVIDVKDYTGRIAFPSSHPLLKDNVSQKCGAPDMREFLSLLHDKEIYTIARITVFQDPNYTQKRPDLAIKKASATTTVWSDYKGLSFIDVGARDFWKYIEALGHEAYEIGFDELNFDYVRFPSDGNMQDIYYPFSEEIVIADPEYGKARVLKQFFAHLFKSFRHSGAVLSADLFGMTTTNTDDLNIGQVLENAFPYFDYIAPMVYPSHYPATFNGFANPNHYPYEVIKFSLDSGVERAIAATTTPLKIRPWLQDFDYGGNYGADEVRAQIQATYDAGLTGWMLWDPVNIYTRDALLSE
tara:strand:+ start:3283 stop:4461 length:1179 start_codon:yes stop_codon:yes gene_type:complete